MALRLRGAHARRGEEGRQRRARVRARRGRDLPPRRAPAGRSSPTPTRIPSRRPSPPTRRRAGQRGRSCRRRWRASTTRTRPSSPTRSRRSARPTPGRSPASTTRARASRSARGRCCSTRWAARRGARISSRPSRRRSRASCASTRTRPSARYDDDEAGRAILESAARTTALVLRGLLAADRHHPLAARLARGLLAMREKGAWRSTQENGWALLALRDYRAAQESSPREMEARAFLGARDDRRAASSRARPTPSSMATVPAAQVIALGGPVDVPAPRRGAALLRGGAPLRDGHPAADGARPRPLREEAGARREAGGDRGRGDLDPEEDRRGRGGRLARARGPPARVGRGAAPGGDRRSPALPGSSPSTRRSTRPRSRAR